MSRSDARPITVLLVEDDAVTRELMAQVLRTGGFEVVSAPTGERALLTLREERAAIDWLVTKVDLPGLACGWIVADEFRTQRPGRAAVFASDRLAGAGSVVRGAIVARERAPYDVLDILRGLAATEAQAEARAETPAKWAA
jgi:CheY-like chemotaxis protein